MSISQPEVSRLFKGHFREYSVERLVNFLTAFDRDVEIVVRPAKSRRRAGRISFTSEAAYFAMGGQIVDATIIEAPHQRNTDEEKRDIKEGKVPEAWQDKPHKLAQKDMDARWTLKRGKAKPAQKGKPNSVKIAIPVFGYKNHIATDVKYSLIRSFTVSDAATHDGGRLKELARQDTTVSGVWAHTAFRSGKIEAMLLRRGLFSRIHHRRSPGKALSEARAKANRARSKACAHRTYLRP